MRIGVISDTHDRLPTFQAALRLLSERGIDTLIHAGDIIAPFAARLLAGFEGTVYVVYGNNDGERRGLHQVLPQIQDGPLWVTLGGRRILVHHFIEQCSPDDIGLADIIITGHTHEAAVDFRSDKLFLNPGECCGWVTGRCTVAVLDLEQCAVEMIGIPACDGAPACDGVPKEKCA